MPESALHAIGLLPILLLVLLVVGSLLLRRTIDKMRVELNAVKFEKIAPENEKIEAEAGKIECLSRYTSLTKNDYYEILEKIRKELKKSDEN